MMALLNVFAVYDQKADAYLPPWVMPKVVMAKRVFGDCINSESHQFYHHPEDYTLFHLGHWSEETGTFTPLAVGNVSLGVGIEYVIQEESENMDLFEKSKEARPNGEESDSEQETLEHGAPVQSGAKSNNPKE